MSTRNVMRRSGFAAWFLACLFTTLGAGSANGFQRSFGHNVNGESINSLAAADTKAVVLFFTASDCPIANRYLPQIQSLESKYAAQKVVFWFIYPNVGETAASVRQHEANYGLEERVLLDPEHRLVNFTHASVTPEVAVLIPQVSGSEPFRIAYRGRIDNRYIHIGQQRPRATQFDLDTAIADVLQNRRVQPPTEPAVGCGIIGQR